MEKGEALEKSKSVGESIEVEQDWIVLENRLMVDPVFGWVYGFPVRKRWMIKLVKRMYQEMKGSLSDHANVRLVD